MTTGGLGGLSDPVIVRSQVGRSRGLFYVGVLTVRPLAVALVVEWLSEQQFFHPIVITTIVVKLVRTTQSDYSLFNHPHAHHQTFFFFFHVEHGDPPRAERRFTNSENGRNRTKQHNNNSVQDVLANKCPSSSQIFCNVQKECGGLARFVASLRKRL